MNKTGKNIFEYEFDWYEKKPKCSTVKKICCEKFKKKGKSNCKKCPLGLKKARMKNNGITK